MQLIGVPAACEVGDGDDIVSWNLEEDGWFYFD